MAPPHPRPGMNSDCMTELVTPEISSLEHVLPDTLLQARHRSLTLGTQWQVRVICDSLHPNEFLVLGIKCKD